MNSRKLWIPDASWVCAILTLAYCLFLTDGWRQLFRDSDTGWHIRTGERILSSRTLPHVDPYSFSKASEPWFAWEWAADVATAFAGSYGLAGVALLYASSIGLATWMWWQLTWAVRGDFLLGWLFAIPMLSTTNVHWLARPHIFGWLFALGAVWIVERVPERPRFRWLVLVGLMSIVWTNVHASFFLFPVILMIYTVGDIAGPLVFASTTPRVARVRWFVAAACVAALGTLVNPYGWRVHQHVFAYLMNGELIDRIAEFQSFNFHVEGAGQILLALGLAAAGGLLALMQGRVAQFLLVLLFLALGLRSARGLPLIGLLLLPIANGAITQALSNPKGLREPIAHHMKAAFAYSSRLRAIDLQLGGGALTPFVLVLLFVVARTPAIQAHAGFSPAEFPVVAASEQIAKLPVDARILAPDKFGGYLIYRFNGERKVYFDGRSDFYGSAFMKNYISLLEVRPNWQDELSKYGFTHALLPNRYSLIPALEQAGWKRIYTDEVATLLAR